MTETTWMKEVNKGATEEEEMSQWGVFRHGSSYTISDLKPIPTGAKGNTEVISDLNPATVQESWTLPAQF